MATKKISELSTKSFLSNPGAAANSYVLINYEDSTTNAPVTYKASLQELGKAIATELKLPTVTVSQGVPNLKVKTASNGAYVDNAISGFASTGYVTTMAGSIANDVVSDLVPSLIMLATRDLASTGYVTAAVADAGGGNTELNLTDSYPFANDGDALPIRMYNPNAYLVFAPAPEGGGTVGPPYVQLPGNETASPINLAGPFEIISSEVEVTCTNLFVDHYNQRLSTVSPTTGEPVERINSNYIGDFIKNATIDDETRDLRPVFIDTNTNTLYIFNNTQRTWQTISL